MRPVLIPLLERLGRRALRSRGVSARFVGTPLGPVHVYDGPGGGSLAPTVFLHGIGASATPFAPVMMRLLPHVLRVVAPDYPGHGFSHEPASQVTPLSLFESMTVALDAVLDKPAVLVGNSLGGALALHYAIARPERVRGLVLLAPAGARSTEDEWRALRSSFDFASRAEALLFMGRVYHRVPLLARAIAHELAAATMQRRAVREILAAATHENAHAPEALAALAMPVLLLWGKSERLLPSSHLAWYRAHLPKHVVIEELEGVGHVPQVDAPGRTALKILELSRGC